MTLIHGFKLQKEEKIPELRAVARIYRHAKTRAEVLSIETKDENKVFGITFRTPPQDSTGLPHIMEHSVLCGSRKYPVKEPFVELLKGSLNTFLNAFTYPDKTCYPVASQNLKDFYNLMDVYLDAVFFPRLTPYIFQQEGWHYELKDPNAPLVIKGVVYNEMKGAYSSPDNLLSELSIQSLFPDTPYGFDSGGDPKKIPELTFERFIEFHRNYYHPSNARIYFYGDDPLEERLRRLDTILREFEPLETNSEVRIQPPFDHPKRITRTFMAGEKEKDSNKGMVTVNWVLADTLDVKTNLALQILGYILIGMSASPLKKALIDSGLGEDIAGLGLENELRQTVFSVGLKGLRNENMEKVEPLITKTLKTLVREGIDREIVDAALNTVEFRLRENNTGQMPRGLIMMLRSLTAWLYEADPVAPIAFENPLASIKQEAIPGFFEGMIKDFLLTNTHRTTLYLRPDPEQRQREEKEERERLDKIKASMTPEQIDKIIKNTLELERIQKTPDSPEALQTIPLLKLSDLERQEKPIPCDEIQQDGATLLFHDIFSNGILYLDVGLDLHSLPVEYLPYVPLFGRALVSMGTEKEDFVSLSKHINRKTGGITPQLFISSVYNRQGSKAMLFIRGKAIGNKAEDLFHIITDIMLHTRFDNHKRFKQILMEEKARQEQRLVPEGHHLVNTRLMSHFNESGFVSEQMRGISYLFFLRKLVSRIDSDWDSILFTFKDMLKRILTKKRLIVNITSDKKDFTYNRTRIEDLVASMPSGHTKDETWPKKIDATKAEGLTIPAQINFVGKGCNIFKSGYSFHGSAIVITRYIRNTWLWNQVRVQGGAYGAFCTLGRISGVLTMVSYRDPNTDRTLNTFDSTGEFLKNTDIDDKELTKAIIGTMGDIDPYRLPDAKGFVSMTRFLTGDTIHIRQKIREEIMATTISHFRKFAGVLDEIKRSGIVKILGPENTVKKAIGGTEADIVKVM